MMNAPLLAPWPYPFWIAHRGGGRHAPENTLAAFRLGAAHGWRCFECDAKLSADGVPFLLHDDTLDRTTNGSGRADRPWAELSQLDAGSWHSAQHAGEPPATLAALARFIQAAGLSLNVEIKPMPGLEEATGEAVARLLLQHWGPEHTPPLLSSFAPAALVGARTAAPRWPRALLLDEWRSGWQQDVTALGCVALGAHHPMLDEERIAQLHDQGLRVLAYTVNDVQEVQRLREAGVDSLFTDEIHAFAPGPQS